MMQYYRDNNGNRIGYTRQLGLVEVGFVMFGGRVGYYNPAIDVTYTPEGSRVGRGNLLCALIYQASLR